MRENKDIDASVTVVQVPIEQLLPENLRPLIHGRASGKLVWTRDSSGKQVSSDGDLTIDGGRIDDISVFRQLALLHDNPSLKDFAFDEATCHFHLQDGICTLQLKARSPDKFDIGGTVTYTFSNKQAALDVTFGRLPLQTWLPPEFKPGTGGFAQAALKWQGQLDTVKQSSGTVAINLDGAEMHLPAMLQEAVSPKRLRTPDKVIFQKAELDLDYQDENFHLSRGTLVLPGILNAQLSGSLSADTMLQATVDWQGLTIQEWLPQELAEQFSGDINGHAVMQVRKWNLGEGEYGGDITLLHGELSYTSVQSMLARFTDDRRLLQIPLTRAHFAWAWDHGSLTVSDIDLRGLDELGVQGTLHMSLARKLSGTLWVGTDPAYLKALDGAADAVFLRHADKLVWAKVTVSGTTKRPKEDLTAQVIMQLKSRPFVVLGLGFKLASWYAGNLVGAEDEWKRPPKVNAVSAP
jgi:hypothetical protein